MLTTSNPTDDPKTAPDKGSAVPVKGDRHLTSASLFGDAEVVRIQHNGMTYTLRKTRYGKLILTK